MPHPKPPRSRPQASSPPKRSFYSFAGKSMYSVTFAVFRRNSQIHLCTILCTYIDGSVTGWSLFGDECSDLFAQHDTLEVMFFENIKYDNRHVIVHAKRK